MISADEHEHRHALIHPSAGECAHRDDPGHDHERCVEAAECAHRDDPGHDHERCVEAAEEARSAEVRWMVDVMRQLGDWYADHPDFPIPQSVSYLSRNRATVYAGQVPAAEIATLAQRYGVKPYGELGQIEVSVKLPAAAVVLVLFTSTEHAR